MSNTQSTRFWCYCKIIKMPTLTVWTEHHHTQEIGSLCCDPHTLSTMATSYDSLEDISRGSRITNTKQCLKLLPREPLQSNLADQREIFHKIFA